jgi:hypothetical protein
VVVQGIQIQIHTGTGLRGELSYNRPTSVE